MTDSAGEAKQGMWGGRFELPPDELFRRFNDSLPVDRHLVREDIAGSIAWADGLRDVGVLTAEECRAIQAALRDIDESVAADPGLLTRASDEDVHSWVERELIARVGDAGRKLHTGRSRNDQVATDLRLWLRAAVDARGAELHALQAALLDFGQREREVIVPGYTHLQRAQPVLLAHWCLAYVEMLGRDVLRLNEARSRINICPLGSAALAGSSFPINRENLAMSLGFESISRNSLDAVSDRDFVIEVLSVASLSMLHLSRICEDLIIYNSSEFGFLELDDAVTSGSSLMPQKKNPDSLELIRGKTGRIIGHLSAAMIMVKGTPLAYNKDFQEDKPALFDAMHEWSLCLRMAVKVIESLRARPLACRAAAEGAFSNATAFANYLVKRGTPFREAHEITGRLVRHALSQGKLLEQLTLEDIRRFAPRAEQDVFQFISLEAVLAQCDVPGGTAPMRVEAALREARTRLDARRRVQG